MKTKHLIAFSLAMAVAAVSATATSAELDGAKTFKKRCGSCHTLTKHAIGPNLKGVVGRKAGSTDFAKYKAIAGADWTWDTALIGAWITNQKDFLKSKGIDKKTAMSVKITKEEEREAILKYLKENS